MKSARIAFRKIVGMMCCATACLLAVLASIVMGNVDLVAYGIKGTHGRVFAIVAGLGAVAFGMLVAARCFLRSRGGRLWGALLILPACIAFSGASVFVLHMRSQFDKGDSNLHHLAKFSRDLNAWQSRVAVLRAGILRSAGLDPLPERTPLSPVIHSRREKGGYAVENVILETIPGFFLAGNLYSPVPRDEGVKKPVVLIAHGHFKEGRLSEDTQRLCALFARMGAIAFTWDMVGRGESTQAPHNDPHALTLQLWDSMRVLDFLLAMPDADPTRVGMTGASGGGTQTFLCAAVDDRVTVSAPVVMVSSWVYGGCECESGLPIHRGAGYATNNAEIAAMAAPRPQIIVSIDEDWTRTVPDREFPTIRSIYALFGKDSDIENAHLAGEHHDYGPSKRDAVCRFFARHLGLNMERISSQDGKLDEASIQVESAEAMRALDVSHPLPQRALKGWESVSAAIRALQKSAR